MFAIGSSLREARERRGFPISRIEEATRIRARYLKALEDERFDLLPGDAYARAFLREYADFLGLEPQPFVDELQARFATHEEPAIAPMGLPRPRAVPRYAGVALTAVALALLGAWQLTTQRSGESPKVRAFPAVPPPPPARVLPRPPSPARARPKSTAARLVLRAERGPCWVTAHVASREGRVLWEGTMEPGQTIRLTAKRLWLRIGAPWNIDARLAGKPLQLPHTVANLVVTRRGLEPA